MFTVLLGYMQLCQYNFEIFFVSFIFKWFILHLYDELLALNQLTNPLQLPHDHKFGKPCTSTYILHSLCCCNLFSPFKVFTEKALHFPLCLDSSCGTSSLSTGFLMSSETHTRYRIIKEGMLCASLVQGHALLSGHTTLRDQWSMTLCPFPDLSFRFAHWLFLW